jgi:hypothetical protein
VPSVCPPCARRPPALTRAAAALTFATAVAACTVPNPAYNIGPDPDGAADTRLPDGNATDARLPDGNTTDARFPDGAAADQVPGTADTAVTADTSAEVPAVAGPDLVTGLVGYWRCDDGVGSDRVLDRSGQGNVGMLESLDRNGAWTAGRSGGALLVGAAAGAGVRVAPSASLDRIQQFTVAAWVYREMGRPYASVISRQIGDTDGEQFGLTFAGDNLSIYLPPTGDRKNVVRANLTTPMRQWVHAAASYDGTRLRLYQNGVERGMQMISMSLPATSKPLYLGTNRNTSLVPEPLAGRLDEVVLYERALPADAIAALAGGTQPIP